MTITLHVNIQEKPQVDHPLLVGAVVDRNLSNDLLLLLCGPVINSVFGRRCRKVVSRGKEDTRVWYWETMFSQMVSALLMFLDISSTILWRCKLKSLQNGNLKKRIIHLSRNIIHMTYMTFIFLKVFWIRTNTVNVRGKNSINILSIKKWTIGF